LKYRRKEKRRKRKKEKRKKRKRKKEKKKKNSRISGGGWVDLDRKNPYYCIKYKNCHNYILNRLNV